MMTLTTWPEPTNMTGAVRIHWKTGIQNSGVIDVRVGENFDNASLIAELCAIRHLLLTKQVFNRLPMSGRGLGLQVSTGSIRKLFLGTSNKRDAIPFARFLRPRFDEIQIKPHRLGVKDFHHTDGPVLSEKINVDDPYFHSPYDPVEGAAIGRVFVTAHAVEQYISRCTSETINAPWKSLVGRLLHEDLAQIPLPDNVIKHKEKKYGKDNHVEAWGHANSLFGYLVVKDKDGNRTLVTVYRRSTGR